MGAFAGDLKEPLVLRTAEIPHYPTPTVQGHAGKLAIGRVQTGSAKSLPVLTFQGRSHLYESGDLETVLFPTRLALSLGVTTLLVTNAAGGINRTFKPGDLMLIRDTINHAMTGIPVPGSHTFLASPTVVLDASLRKLILQKASELGITLKEGVYCWVKGPSYETAAEIEMFSRIGADAVGMSTVPELLLASRSGVQTAGISLITNFATGRSPAVLSHDEVTETASRVQETFVALLSSIILSLRPATPV